MYLYAPIAVPHGETSGIAKSISKTLGGELLRVQFSMMQSDEAYNYVFGAEHSKNSFARDMMARESNVILIDEFDKVNPIFYNAFMNYLTKENSLIPITKSISKALYFFVLAIF